MRVLLLILDVTVLALTLLPLFPGRHWLFRAPEFPRLQIAVALLVLLLLHVFLRPLSTPFNAVLIGALGAAFLYQLAWTLPYTRLYRREVGDASQPLARERQVSVLAANVLMSNRNAAGLLALVRRQNPDVVLLMETDAWWESAVAPLRETHPHVLACPLSNLYGMHLFSRLPMEKGETRFLVEEDVPSMHVVLRLQSGDVVRLHAVHPAPPSPTENETSKERDAELLQIARECARDPSRRIVTGDFNDVAWSMSTRLFRRVSGLLDPRIGRGRFTTFPAAASWLRFPVDHVFHGPDFTLVDLVVLSEFGSDHLPIYYCLQYEPGAEQSAPARQQGDLDKTDKRIHEGMDAGEND